jgi:CRP/FNR family transcriptional regulator, cAMP and macrophage regulator
MTERAAEVSPGFRDAVWVSRCVGRAESSPLRPRDLEGLAQFLSERTLEAGEPLHHVGGAPAGVYIVKEGCLELAVPGKPGRAVIQTLRPGDVDGDIQLLLGMAMPYEARANVATTVLVIRRGDFDRLLAEHPSLAHRWLTSVSQRLARSHARLTGLLGQPLEVQVAQLLLEETDGDVVALSQATLAAMLGARRPSVNKVLRTFAERGWVELAYRSVHLRDRPAIAALAERST